MQRELEFKKNSEFDRGLRRDYCFSVPMGHPWPVPRFIPGASHGKTVIPPQFPIHASTAYVYQAQARQTHQCLGDEP